MINTVNISGRVLNIHMDDDIAYICIEAIRPYKEATGEFRRDIFNAQCWKSAIDSLLTLPKIDDKVYISGSLFNENGRVYIDVYQIEKLSI